MEAQVLAEHRVIMVKKLPFQATRSLKPLLEPELRILVKVKVWVEAVEP